ncbi:MAG: hypothetical protein KIH69_021425 [Anaerolineae bacterium]|nr:hypothetical protein [Anaerolineae bacterium]
MIPHSITRRKFLLIAAMSGLPLVACGQAATPAATAIAPTVAPQPTDPPKPTEAPKPTNTPAPTATAKPTEAPKPTDAPKPTATAIPRATTISTKGAAAKPIIRIIENPWSAAIANAHVAKHLIESKLDYRVELVQIDEKAQWEPLSKNEASASLEVWPSGHAETYEKYVKGNKTVEELGKLGVIGKINWYVPTYMVKERPELATWEGVKKNAALFKTQKTGEKGRFVAGDPSWPQFDEFVIKNLGLSLQVEVVGSEEAQLQLLEEAYNKKQPFLFYFWTPHSVHHSHQLTAVKLPKFNDECGKYMDDKAQNSKVNCEYPAEILYKIASAKLKTDAPDVYQFLKNFQYADTDQIEMMAAIDIAKQTPAQAAKDWIERSENIWQNWLPAKK